MVTKMAEHDPLALLYEIPDHVILGSASGVVRVVDVNEYAADEWQSQLSEAVHVEKASVTADVRTWSTSDYPHSSVTDRTPWTNWRGTFQHDGQAYEVGFQYIFSRPDTLWLLGDQEPDVRVAKTHRIDEPGE